MAVILDSGPWMLGRNRLIGLAALFYLAIRAERTKSTLRWIVPQNDRHEWIDGLNRSTIQRYLGQVVQGPLPSETIDASLANLDPDGRLECWYVGSQQTAHLADHPDIGSSFLLRENFQAGTALVNVTNRGRPLAQVNVTFEDNPTCIAALRRPFKPEIRQNSAPTDTTANLTTLPFHTDWVLDPSNMAVILRLPSGVLWQPILPRHEAEAVWLSLRAGDVLLGVRAGGDKLLRAMVATPTGELGKSTVNLIEVNLRPQFRLAKKTSTMGDVTIDIAQFATMGLGHFHTKPQYSIVDADGHALSFAIDQNTLREPIRSKNKILFQDGTYRIQIREGNPALLQVISMTRGTKMLSQNWQNVRKTFEEMPRRFLFSPSSKVLAMSADDRTFMILGLGNAFSIEMPEGVKLLHFENITNAIGWDAPNSQLVEMRFDSGICKVTKTTPYHGTQPGLPRYCPLTSTVFAMTPDEEDGLGRFVPIQTKRGWKDVKPIDIGEAIEKARTVWLEN